ncbi:uncharacterized protein zgc:113176 [Dicentrarchus labrax]|uniref:uncharacterized protein zgc:113176 n=1 Tax=Dicentrarchus labrax TaxID=13489 RepID=UPI0021F63B2C|nr:uncharacterized protein zgc:113176 [Dicentrarchus labrax]
MMEEEPLGKLRQMMPGGAAGSSGRLPYQALVNQTLDIEVKGLPNDFTLKKPSFYGRKQLEMILKAAEQISFQIKTQVDAVQFVPQGTTSQPTSTVMDTNTEVAGACTQTMTVEEIFESMYENGAAAKPLHSSVEEAVAEAVPIIEGTSNACSVCGADFYDPDKNRKRKWRSWSQCLVCHGWSHTACGFKRNMCAKCHTE